MTQTFILSPVGTSILTNTAREIKANGKTVIENSNVKNESDINSEDTEILSRIIDATERSLSNANVKRAAEMSAEINGIAKFYEGDFRRGNSDYHCLLRTDTWLGETSATLVKNWLETKGLTVEIKHQTDLQTKEFTSFQLALSELVKWCDEVVRGYKDARYKIVFNLTGGYKSVQGFLQTLAMFYADETVYVFEASENLMRIPRLPIEMSVEKEVRKNITAYRQLSLGLPVCLSKTDLAETMLMRVDKECCLSPWGEIVWQQVKKKIYSEELLKSPSVKIRYGDKFEDSAKGIDKKRRIAVNEKIDDLARKFEKGQSLSSLDFKELRGDPCPPSTHEIDAWHDQDAKRIFGHFETASENHIFVLDKLDKALH